MATVPQFGGTNGVDELDLGQPGGARAAANSARYVVQVHQQPDRTTAVDQKVVQQNIAFQDVLGYDLGEVQWIGTLKVINDATLQAIVSDLNKAKHGSARVAGELAAPNPAAVQPTVLKNSFGSTLSTKAVIRDWSFDGPVKTLSGGAPYTLIVGLRVVFKLLG